MVKVIYLKIANNIYKWAVWRKITLGYFFNRIKAFLSKTSKQKPSINPNKMFLCNQTTVNILNLDWLLLANN